MLNNWPVAQPENNVEDPTAKADRVAASQIKELSGEDYETVRSYLISHRDYVFEDGKCNEALAALKSLMRKSRDGRDAALEEAAIKCDDLIFQADDLLEKERDNKLAGLQHRNQKNTAKILSRRIRALKSPAATKETPQEGKG